MARVTHSFSHSRQGHKANILEWLDEEFTRDIIHGQIDYFNSYKEANNRESVIGGCKSHRENMVDAQQALYLPNIHLKMVLPHLQWLFQYLSLFQIEKHYRNHGEIKEGEMVLW